MKKLAYILILMLAVCFVSQAQTNVIFGYLADMGLTPQSGTVVTLSLISPNPKLINGVWVNVPTKTTKSTAAGLYSFNNLVGGQYEVDAGSAFLSFVVQNTTSGSNNVVNLMTNVYVLQTGATLAPGSGVTFATNAGVVTISASSGSGLTNGSTGVTLAGTFTATGGNILTNQTPQVSMSQANISSPGSGILVVSNSANTQLANLIVNGVQLGNGIFQGNGSGISGVMQQGSIIFTNAPPGASYTNAQGLVVIGTNAASGGGGGLTNITVQYSLATLNTNYFLLYGSTLTNNAGDANVGNTNVVIWNYSLTKGCYTNGIAAYAAYFTNTIYDSQAGPGYDYAAGAAGLVIYSNTVLEYYGINLTNQQWGAFSASLVAAGKPSRLVNSPYLPAPNNLATINGLNSPLTFAGINQAIFVPPTNNFLNQFTTNGGTTNVLYSTEGFYSPQGYIVTGPNCAIETDFRSLLPWIQPNYVGPAAILASSVCTNYGPKSSMFSDNACVNYEIGSFIGGCANVVMYLGQGDNSVVASEAGLFQSLGNGCSSTVAAYSFTNFASGQVLQAATASSYIDTNSLNFGRIGGKFVYDNVNDGLASGSYQSNSGSALWDFGDGNSLSGTSKIFLGFTNNGILIQPSNVTVSASTTFTAFTNTFTGSLNVSGTVTGNGSGLTGLNPANLLGGYKVKSLFQTNYLATTNDAILFCSGTNQVITLPSNAVAGFVLTIAVASTNGSVIVTNVANTVLGASSQIIYGPARASFISDSTNYW